MFYSLSANFDGIFNLFRYITFRTGASLLTSLFIYILLGDKFINFIKNKFTQPIRKEGPQTHLKKQGTPTMGGVLILFSILVSSLLWCNLSNGYVWIVLFTMCSFGMIGFVDDYFKVVHGNAYRGLSAKLRLILQFTLSWIVCFGIYRLMPNEFKMTVTIPFFKNILWNLGILYFVFVAFVIVGTANAVNLTDGLDGLALDHWVLGEGFGGCTYDIGVYPICASHFYADAKMKEFQAEAVRNPEFNCDFGMDADIFYENGIYANVRANWFYQAENKGKAVLVGEKGYLEIPAYWKGTKAYLHKAGQVTEIVVDMESDFEGEITHAIECIENGLLESPILGEEMSVEIIRVVEAVQKRL